MAQVQPLRLELEQAHALLEVARGSAREVGGWYEVEVAEVRALNEKTRRVCEIGRVRVERMYAALEWLRARVDEVEAEAKEVERLVEGRRREACRLLSWFVEVAGREGDDKYRLNMGGEDEDEDEGELLEMVKELSEQITLLSSDLTSRAKRSPASLREQDVLMKELNWLVNLRAVRLEENIRTKRKKIGELTRSAGPSMSLEARDEGENEKRLRPEEIHGSDAKKVGSVEKFTVELDTEVSILVTMESACEALRRQWENLKIEVDLIKREESLTATDMNMEDSQVNGNDTSDEGTIINFFPLQGQTLPTDLSITNVNPSALDTEDPPFTTLPPSPNYFMAGLTSCGSLVEQGCGESLFRTVDHLEMQFGMVMSNLYEIEKDIYKTDMSIREIKDIYEECLKIEAKLKEIEERKLQSVVKEAKVGIVQAKEGNDQLNSVQMADDIRSSWSTDKSNHESDLLASVLTRSMHLLALRNQLASDYAMLETEHQDKYKEIEGVSSELRKMRPGQLLSRFLSRSQESEGSTVTRENQMLWINEPEELVVFEEGEEDLALARPEDTGPDTMSARGLIVETKLRVLLLESSLYALRTTFPEGVAQLRRALAESLAGLSAVECDLLRCYERVCGLCEELKKIGVGIDDLRTKLDDVIRDQEEEVQKVWEVVVNEVKVTLISESERRGETNGERDSRGKEREKSKIQQLEALTSQMRGEDSKQKNRMIIHELDQLENSHTELLTLLDNYKTELLIVKEEDLKLVVALLDREKEKIVGSNGIGIADKGDRITLKATLNDELAKMLDRIRQRDLGLAPRPSQIYQNPADSLFDESPAPSTDVFNENAHISNVIGSYTTTSKLDLFGRFRKAIRIETEYAKPLKHDRSHTLNTANSLHQKQISRPLTPLLVTRSPFFRLRSSFNSLLTPKSRNTPDTLGSAKPSGVCKDIESVEPIPADGNISGHLTNVLTKAYSSQL